MRDRDARRLALTLTGFLAGHRNRCDRKPLDEPPDEVLLEVASDWEGGVFKMKASDLQAYDLPGVDFAIAYRGRIFGFYRDGRNIPPVPPKVADFYICLGLGDCPTWVYKFYSLYRLPIVVNTEE